MKSFRPRDAAAKWIFWSNQNPILFIFSFFGRGDGTMSGRPLETEADENKTHAWLDYSMFKILILNQIINSKLQHLIFKKMDATVGFKPVSLRRLQAQKTPSSANLLPPRKVLRFID